MFSTIGLGAAFIFGMILVDPSFDEFTNSADAWLVASRLDSLPVSVGVALIFALYVLGEVIMFVPRSFRRSVRGWKEEDKLLLDVAFSNDALVISEFQSHRNRWEMFDALGALLVGLGVFEITFNFQELQDVSWLNVIVCFAIGGAIIKTVSDERRRFGELLAKYKIGQPA
ncbi:hypothetical protein [Aliiroseovarius sp. F47248L]|uniref:hypothetical protein n=1 Tax=Aliiroseovarius sp. F47248L TaxID=2926420 RepID=UPI001FF28A67|nr:hypothetical protein [Aliiroseovarius sp. F47248L]MCK0139504.1 hypothetical protein [Aliiroseovarius sp. F47248L]